MAWHGRDQRAVALSGVYQRLAADPDGSSFTGRTLSLSELSRQPANGGVYPNGSRPANAENARLSRQPGPRRRNSRKTRPASPWLDRSSETAPSPCPPSSVSRHRSVRVRGRRGPPTDASVAILVITSLRSPTRDRHRLYRQQRRCPVRGVRPSYRLSGWRNTEPIPSWRPTAIPSPTRPVIRPSNRSHIGDKYAILRVKDRFPPDCSPVWFP